MENLVIKRAYTNQPLSPEEIDQLKHDLFVLNR